MPRLLIVEDDPQLVAAIEKTLSLDGSFTVEAVSDPDAALAAALRGRPDLILLDIRLPGGDGRILLKGFKEHPALKSIPVIFLTGLASEGDRVLGLNLGADDYVVKPFGALELLARIRAVLRRAGPAAPAGPALAAGPLKLDFDAREASVAGRALRLQPKEFEILALLAAHPGRPLSRAYLIENTSSYGMAVATRSLDTHIKNLRRKLGPHAGLIETVPKLGYRLAPDARPARR